MFACSKEFKPISIGNSRVQREIDGERKKDVEKRISVTADRDRVSSRGVETPSPAGRAHLEFTSLNSHDAKAFRAKRAKHQDRQRTGSNVGSEPGNQE